MPRAAFAQRFIESFRVRDRKAITNGTNIMIVVANISSGVNGMPYSSPFIICSITSGSKSPTINVIRNATVQKSHSAAIFIFQSSRAYTSIKMKNTRNHVASFSSYDLCGFWG